MLHLWTADVHFSLLQNNWSCFPLQQPQNPSVSRCTPSINRLISADTLTKPHTEYLITKMLYGALQIHPSHCLRLTSDLLSCSIIRLHLKYIDNQSLSTLLVSGGAAGGQGSLPGPRTNADPQWGLSYTAASGLVCCFIILYSIYSVSFTHLFSLVFAPLCRS